MPKLTKELIEKMRAKYPNDVDYEDLDELTSKDIYGEEGMPIPDDDLPWINIDAIEDPVIREMRTDPKTSSDYITQHDYGDFKLGNNFDNEQLARERLAKEAPRLRQQAKDKAFAPFEKKRKKGK